MEGPGGRIKEQAREIEVAVESLALPLANDMAFKLIDVEYSRGGGRGIVRIYLDKPGGITLDDCEAFSRQMSDILDSADPVPGSYFLEVSSPGLDRPLKKDRDFESFKGRRVEVRTFGPIAPHVSVTPGTDGPGKESKAVREVHGELIGLIDGNVVVRDESGLVWEIPREQVAKARLFEV